MLENGVTFSRIDFLPALAGMLPVFFTLIFIIWVIYTAIAAYHWFRYGYDSWVAVPAVFVHVFISGWLMIYAVSGFH